MHLVPLSVYMEVPFFTVAVVNTTSPRDKRQCQLQVASGRSDGWDAATKYP
jgi:hypothetical protein